MKTKKDFDYEMSNSFLDTSRCYLLYVPHGSHGPISQNIGYHHSPVAVVSRGHDARSLAKSAARRYGAVSIRNAWGTFETSFLLTGNKVIELDESFDGLEPNWRRYNEKTREDHITPLLGNLHRRFPISEVENF